MAAVLGIVAAVAGLATALLPLLGARGTATETPHDPSVKLVSYERRPPRRGPASVARKKKFLAGLTLLWFCYVFMYTGFALSPLLPSRHALKYAHGWSKDLQFGVFWAMAIYSAFNAMMFGRPLLVLVQSHGKGPSPASRSAEAVMEGDYDAILHRCRNVMKRMRMQMMGLDHDAGLFRARKGRFSNKQTEKYRLYDEITVRVLPAGENRYRVCVESDGVRPSFLPDADRNAQNAHKFIENLAG